MFSLISKVNKGHRYYYLREQRREGGKVRPHDFYLGRLDAGAIPRSVARMIREKYGWYKWGWMHQPEPISLRISHIKHALERLREIDEARRWMASRGRRTAGPKERRWLDSTPRKVAKLEAALQANKESKQRKVLAFYK